MKKCAVFVAVLLAALLSASSTFALSDAEYKSFMKNSQFKSAASQLTAAWKDAKSKLSGAVWENLLADQRKWVKSGRDQEAQTLIKGGTPRVDAYTKVTVARVEFIKEAVRSAPKSSVNSGSNKEEFATTQGRDGESEKDGDAIVDAIVDDIVEDIAEDLVESFLEGLADAFIDDDDDF